ncbi:hypothetical protein [Pandoraea sputorum]|uniref:hypothetical protein n=1 Tax=Pandoraea sputorum TaxID=93222 RepID=UPI0012409B90|nr:hypothetical protein [Pandoraea sputorum]VVE78498.1 hypothetical protein PSP31120_01708 [Pandoraea sputorum]
MDGAIFAGRVQHISRASMLAFALAFAITAALHVLGLLALMDFSRPKVDFPRPERRTLTVTLIPAETRRPVTVPPSDASPASRATRSTSSRNAAVSGLVQRRSGGEPISGVVRNPSGPVAPAADASEATKSTNEAIDWRKDIRGIEAHRPAGHGKTPQPFAGEAGNPRESATAVLDREMSKAARGDCRNRYSQMGLLAIPMLAVDALSQSGCQW